MKLVAWFSKANPFGEVLSEDQIHGSWELHPFGESATLRANTLIKAAETLSIDVVAMKKPGGKCGICLRQHMDENISAMAQGDESAALAVYYGELGGYLNFMVSEAGSSGNG